MRIILVQEVIETLINVIESEQDATYALLHAVNHIINGFISSGLGHIFCKVRPIEYLKGLSLLFSKVI